MRGTYTLSSKCLGSKEQRMARLEDIPEPTRTAVANLPCPSFETTPFVIGTGTVRTPGGDRQQRGVDRPGRQDIPIRIGRISRGARRLE